MGMYGKQCPDCGAILDPGEQCDCQKAKHPFKAADYKRSVKTNITSYKRSNRVKKNETCYTQY